MKQDSERNRKMGLLSRLVVEMEYSRWRNVESILKQAGEREAWLVKKFVSTNLNLALCSPHSENIFRQIEQLLNLTRVVSLPKLRNISKVMVCFAEDGCLGGVKWCLEVGAKIDAKGEGNDTALHLACRRNDLPMVKLLLDKEAKFDIPDIFKITALGYAVVLGHFEIVEAICATRRNLNDIPTNAIPPLALSHSNEKITDLLLDRGADPIKALQSMRKERVKRAPNFDCASIEKKLRLAVLKNMPEIKQTSLFNKI